MAQGQEQDQGTGTAPPPVDILLAATVARRFYLGQQSKVEIGNALGISRFKVARLLDAAVAHRIVRIDISVPAQMDTVLSRRMRERFALRHAVVVDLARDGARAEAAPVLPWLAEAGARLVTELARAGDVIGLACGPVTDALTSAVDRLPACEVVQLAGTAAPDPFGEEAVAPVRRLAAAADGRAFTLHTPLVLPNALTASILARQPSIADTLQRFARVTRAVVPIGGWEAGSALYDASTPHERAVYRSLGARAEICGLVLDEDGRTVPTDMNDRMICVDADTLRAVPEVIGVTGGPGTRTALAAALRSGCLTGVVTDAETAAQVLHSGEPRPRGGTPRPEARPPAR
ncbi:transcriptional regulator [Streptomyces sp. ISL-12]|uniref:sugar-binding transcriptional regulator n=1 Tax=Streptomyces sp. ISL-12 TaxID=2819177 RepID=UPI001BE59603|nr:sugar-binding domain-containing protein [Streptomyces sp. ISL-12]MBT2413268.1 transcriptional regulator [Streptomyces sp. ISL-12]